jgi:polyhydroxyalkanoate synthesis regulator phasin
VPASGGNSKLFLESVTDEKRKVSTMEGNMKEFIRKSMLVGMGLATVTREKIELTIDELIKKGEISEKEGKEAIDELVEKSKEMKKDLTDKVENMVSDTLKKLNLPSRDEFQKLKDKVERMDKPPKSKE